MKIKRRKTGYALICSCCDLPFAVIENGRMVQQSRHGHSAHTNALDLAGLKEIVRILEEQEAVKVKGSDVSEPLPLIH
jgi:hypothetical protein